MNGLVNIKSAAQINQEKLETARKKEAATSEYGDLTESRIAAHIRKVWEQNRMTKQEVYYRLLYCLRARKGIYSESEKQQIAQMGGADPIYLKLTGTKCRAASSWVRDILLPIKDRPWELSPTPIPELPDDVKESAMRSVIAQIQQMGQEGMQLNPDDQIQFTNMVKKKILEQMTALANQAVSNMERKIDDMMVDGQYRKAMEEFIEDFVTYPFAVLKGPYYQSKTFLKWVNGKAKPRQENVLCWRRVSPFDVFYSPYAGSLQEGDMIERLRYTRTSLYQLIGLDGFKESEIREVLMHHSENKLNNWMWENFEREKLEQNSSYFLSDKDTIDGLHFWGHVKGQDLLDWGYTGKIDDPIKMYPVDAILIGRNVIRAEINENPMGHRPYHSACWDSVPGSIVGIGLPEQMEDHQKMVNATARALATNMSIGSGPQVAILTDMIANGEDITSIYPMKIWQMKSSITGNSGKPVEFFQPEIKAQELLAVLNQFEQKADDVTNVPRYSYGNEKISGAGSTATGLSMLMNSAAKGIRRAIANVDLNVQQPTVYQTFVEIMMKDPDPSIRGDVKVIATGSAAILIKEQMLESQKEFLQIVTNDIDIAIMGKKGRAKLLSNIAANLDIDPLVIPSDEELDLEEQRQKAMEEEQHKAEVAQMNASTTNPQAEMKLQQQAQQLEQAAAQQEQQAAQQAMQLKQAEDQIKQADKESAEKTKIADQQLKEAEAQNQKNKQLQAQVEQALAKLALEKMKMEQESAKTTADLEVQQTKAEATFEIQQTKTLANIEKAQIQLETTGEKIKAAATKAKLVSSSKEDETSVDGTDSEQKQAKDNSAQVAKIVKDAMTQVADALKIVGAPKKIDVQRDGEGKITGATAKPMTGGVK